LSKTPIENYKHLSYFLAGEVGVVWNRFFPSVLKFKKDVLLYLLEVLDSNDYLSRINEESLEELRKNHIVPDENYEGMFFEQMESYLAKRREGLSSHVQASKPFDSVHLFFEECNFACPYCVMTHTWGEKRFAELTKIKDQTKQLNNTIQLLEQQYHALSAYPNEGFSVTISGGEPLLKFELIKKIVLFIRVEKKDQITEIDVNSNASLLNQEMAEFFRDNNVHLNISIDGNCSHHDSTRVYHNGSGSFADVLESVGLLKKVGFRQEDLEYFQGTLHNFDKIDKEEVFKYFPAQGFKIARLYPSLLGRGSGFTQREAMFVFGLHKESLTKDLRIESSDERRLTSRLDNGVNVSYIPYCNGLGAHLSKFILNYNITDGSLSYLCQFVPEATVKHNHNIDIFDRAIFEKSMEYQYERLDAMKRHCSKCSVVGICSGGCVMNGLDSFNEMNQAGCTYWQTM